MKDNQDELFVIVDEKDKIIGYRSRYNCHHNPSLIHRSANVVLCNRKGQILLQKRSMQKDTYPGKYTISTSGHVGKGESYLQAAQRELKEELGVSVPNLTLTEVFISYMPNETEMVALLKGSHEGPFVFPEDEVEKVEFVSSSLLYSYRDKLTPNGYQSLYRLGYI